MFKFVYICVTNKENNYVPIKILPNAKIKSKTR